MRVHCGIIHLLSEDIAVHECTARFGVEIFQTYLGDWYDVFPQVLSPEQFGWPCKRPRLYTILLRRSSVFLEKADLQRTLKQLFMQTTMDCSAFYCAPEAG